jgi:F-type H+-transporting ATPase subunit delta
LKSATLQYANALADVALEQGATDPILKQLSDFNETYAESAELRTFLGSPAVDREAKHGVIEKLVARLGASRIMRNFLFLVVDHQRTPLLPEMLASFQQVLQQRQGIAEAEVVSATDMNDAQKSQLQHSLEKLTGKKIQAKYAQDPALLGGALVRIGDTIYDDSLRNRLNQMRGRLASE